MISFIIIGYNEGWRLRKSLESVFDAIAFSGINDFEVIYVDSSSTDDSIGRAKKYQGLKIFKITGKCNAAIARNIGANESIGDHLFFIDGDVEIKSEFLASILDEDGNPLHPFVTGQLIDRRYSTKGEYIGETFFNANPLKQDSYIAFTGGIFLIKRELWDLVGGMRNKYKRSQDIDFCLRLAKAGYLLLKKKDVVGIHYTTSYYDEVRKWDMLFKGYFSYTNGILFRDHIFNKYFTKKILYGLFTPLVMILTIFLTINSPAYISFYILALILRTTIFVKINIDQNRLLKGLARIPFQILLDINCILSILLFYPKDTPTKDIKYHLCT